MNLGGACIWELLTQLRSIFATESNILDIGPAQDTLWDMGNIIVSPERSSERDYVITDSVHSMCMYVCGNFCKIDHCICIHWCIPMGLGHNDSWVESHMWPQQMWGQRSSRGQWPLVQVLAKKVHYIHILWCIFMGLGHNDPWVKSHMWPQQMWDQTSSRGQWPLVQGFFFAKKVTVSTYFDVFSWDLDTMILV